MCHRRGLDRQELPATSRCVFRALSGVARGTPSLSRPVRLQMKDGAGGRVMPWHHNRYVLNALRGEGHRGVGSAIGT